MITTLACFAAITALAALAIVAGLLRSARLDAAAHTRSASLLQQQFLTDARLERQRLLDALSDAFLLVDSAATIRFANAAALELFDHRELVHRPVSETLLDPRLANALRHCLESGEPVHARVVLPQQASPRGDLENRGSNAWSIDAARLPAFENEPTLTRVILRDLTAEYQTDQIRKDFVANASHELRTPMAIIHGYLENLLDDNLLDEPATARHFLAIMRKHSERISRIVEDMLVISRLESGEAGSLKIEPFPLRS
jgi:two-component system phosphate regulon sensor histidine kinase PhoR